LIRWWLIGLKRENYDTNELSSIKRTDSHTVTCLNFLLNSVGKMPCKTLPFKTSIGTTEVLAIGGVSNG
jgi:hypothetical protein